MFKYINVYCIFDLFLSNAYIFHSIPFEYNSMRMHFEIDSMEFAFRQQKNNWIICSLFVHLLIPGCRESTILFQKLQLWQKAKTELEIRLPIKKTTLIHVQTNKHPTKIHFNKIVHIKFNNENDKKKRDINAAKFVKNAVKFVYRCQRQPNLIYFKLKFKFDTNKKKRDGTERESWAQPRCCQLNLNDKQTNSIEYR